MAYYCHDINLKTSRLIHYVDNCNIIQLQLIPVHLSIAES